MSRANERGEATGATGAPGAGTHFPLGSALLLVGVFFLTFMSRTILAPLLLSIEADLGVSHAVGGSFFLVISVGLMATMLSSGFVSQRLSHHQTISVAVGLVGVGLLIVSSSQALGWFRVGLVVLGAGAGLYLPSGIATLTDVTPPGQWGRAMALHELGPILGLAAGPLLAELVLRVASWRVLLAALGVASICMGLVFARRGAGGRFHGEPPHWAALREVAATRRFWVITFFFVMAIGLELGVYSMLPTYLVVERGMERSLVNSVVSTSRLTSLLMIFLAGWLSDHLGVQRVFAVVAIAAGAVTALIGFVEGPILVAAVYLQPMLISAFFPAGLSALAGVSTPERRNLAISVVIPLAYLFGAGLIPAILGRLAEAGASGTGFIAIGIVMAAGALVAPFATSR
jgi:NNP family nitrate/nitrite transporter-like MFS transporter